MQCAAAWGTHNLPALQTRTVMPHQTRAGELSETANTLFCQHDAYHKALSTAKAKAQPHHKRNIYV